MTLISRISRIFLALLILAPVPALAQENCTIGVLSKDDLPQYAMPDDPWIYRGTDIPIDQEWLFGELPNGLRYAVRRNGVPPCQVSLRVRIDAGSLHEQEHEQGFAHLIEHLTFRESRHLGSGEALPHFQRMGAAIGYDTNAITSPTHTVYQLDLPNARRDRLDESLRLFAGMIQEPALSQENLAMDVPIVLAEMRESAGPNRRLIMATRELFYTGQLLSERPPIGTVETLEAATAADVRAFHNRWYRPENTVVVLAGDASTDVLASMVERYFADWNPPGQNTQEPDFGVPVAPENTDPANPVGETAVLVEPTSARGLTFGYLRPWVQVVDNLEFNRLRMLDGIAEAVVNRRLVENSRNGASYFAALVGKQNVSRSADITFVDIVPLTDDWEAALIDVRAIIADAMANPPTQQEIDREVAEYDVIFANMLEQARIQAGAPLADEIVGAVDIREAVAAPETFLSLLRDMNHRFTPEAILEHTQGLFEGSVIRAVYRTPEEGEVSAEAIQQALLAPVVANGEARSQAERISFADLPAIGSPVDPAIREPLGPDVLSIVEMVTYPNRVRAILWESTNEPGRVTVRVRFGAGWRGFDEEDGVYADLGLLALVESGMVSLDANDIDLLTTGRKLSFDFTIGDGVFEFEGRTRAEDLADQLYLFAAKFAYPRWDAAPFERARAAALLSYDGYEADPNGIINRDLDYVLRGSDPRFKTPTPDELRSADVETFQRVWTRLLSEGDIEVAVFGDIDPQETLAILNRTFGALPVREPLSEEVASRSVTFPAANTNPDIIHHRGDANQAAALIAWETGGGSAGLPQSRKLEILAQIMSNRLLDAMRERYGTSYSPFTASNWPLDIDSGGHILALVQLEPENVDGFFAEADRIVSDLAINGPNQDDLDRAIEPVRQYITRAMTGHTFWLNRLEGAGFDAMRAAHLQSMGTDYLGTTPVEIQALAKRYLASHGGYRLLILPEADGGS